MRVVALRRLATFASVPMFLAAAGCSAGSGSDTGNGGMDVATDASGLDTGASDVANDLNETAVDTGADAGVQDTGSDALAGDAADGDDAGDEGDANADASVGPTCDGGHAAITGKAFAPNQHDPIPRVAVYVVDDGTTFPAAATSVSCERCVRLSGALAATSSAVDGSFSLVGSTLDAGGTFTVVIVSGGWRRVIRHVVVPPCGSVSLTAMQTAFAGASSGDDIVPRIAVAGFHPAASSSSGDVNDHFVTVLDAIGITSYDTFDPDRSGTGPGTGTSSTGMDLLTLLGTAATLNQYQVLIIPCGSLGNFTVAPHLSSAMVTNLQNWLQAGGRLYASDLAYSVINVPFASAFNWAPGPSSHTGADPANCGVGLATSTTTLPCTVTDSDMTAWLDALGAATGNMINVSELRDPWGAVDSVPPSELVSSAGMPAHGAVWVTGNVSWHTGTSGTVGPAVHPLTVQADYPGTDSSYCGRVVFSSYHVQSSSTATNLTPQERVLEYLFFQLTRCVGNSV